MIICLLSEVDQSQVRERLKMRIGVLEECVKSFELECKSGSETTLRLTAELDRERRKVASSSAALDSVKLVTAPQQMRGNYIKTFTETAAPLKFCGNPLNSPRQSQHVGVLFVTR